MCLYPLHHRTLSFKKYCLFPYCMTLFDTVLYCVTYQVLSYNNFIVSVIEVMPSRKERLVDGLAEREEGFLKTQGQQ